MQFQFLITFLFILSVYFFFFFCNILGLWVNMYVCVCSQAFIVFVHQIFMYILYHIAFVFVIIFIYLFFCLRVFSQKFVCLLCLFVFFFFFAIWCVIWPSMVHKFQVLDVGTDRAFTYGYLAHMKYYLPISPVHALAWCQCWGEVQRQDSEVR